MTDEHTPGSNRLRIYEWLSEQGFEVRQDSERHKELKKLLLDYVKDQTEMYKKERDFALADVQKVTSIKADDFLFEVNKLDEATFSQLFKKTRKGNYPSQLFDAARTLVNFIKNNS